MSGGFGSSRKQEASKKSSFDVMPQKHFPQKSGGLWQVPGVLPVKNQIENRTNPPFHQICRYLVSLELCEDNHVIFEQFNAVHEVKSHLTFWTGSFARLDTGSGSCRAWRQNFTFLMFYWACRPVWGKKWIYLGPVTQNFRQWTWSSIVHSHHASHAVNLRS